MEKKMRLKNKLLFLQTNFAEKKRQDEKKMLHIQILEKKYIELKQFPPITEIREEVFNPKIQNLHLEDNSRTAKKNPYTSLKEYLKCNLIPNPTFDEQSFINLRKNLEKLKKTLLIERKSFKNVFRENNKFIEDISDEIFEMNIRLKEKEKVLLFYFNFI